MYNILGSINKLLTENKIKQYTREILEGVHYIHSNNIIHRDIKGANILLKNGVCKLSDFGSAKLLDGEINRYNSFKGTPNWMAPEVVKNAEYTKYSDIWGVGCTVLEMCTGLPPWSDFKNQMMIF